MSMHIKIPQLKMIKRIAVLLLTIFLFLTIFTATLPSTAAESKNFKVISPVISQSTGMAYSDNLFISIRVEPERTVQITLYNYPDFKGAESLEMVPATSFIKKKQVGDSYYYSAHPRLSFFTKRINKIKSGLYSLRVETLDEKGQPFETVDTYFIAMPSSSKDPVTINKTTPSTRVIFFQKVFKNIFGSTVNDDE